MESFRFYSWFWLLLLPVVVGIFFWQRRYRRPVAAVFSSIADLKRLPVTRMQKVRSLLPILYLLGLCLILLALARPQSGRSESRISGEGIAIELVLDVSGSMEALDFQLGGRDVSRLEAVKHVINEFVIGSKSNGLAGRRDDQVGVVAFGGFADSKCPLTLDHGALVEIVKGLSVPKPIRDRRGRVVNDEALKEELATAIGDGVAVAIDRLRNAKSQSKVIILLTDGDNNAGVVDPREAAAIANESSIRMFTIGIGRTGMVPIPQEDAFGKKVLVSAHFRIDEELLREMARTANGEYFHADDSSGLLRVYSQIDQLAKSNFEESKYSEYTELFASFAWPGAILLFTVGVLKKTRFRSLP
ncbi:MAG: VWA domain-containing protein [Planctomycetes bacterium]|nr:VWA domain-containing protein [Planctomycetota bacterium]